MIKQLGSHTHYTVYKKQEKGQYVKSVSHVLRNSKEMKHMGNEMRLNKENVS